MAAGLLVGKALCGVASLMISFRDMSVLASLHLLFAGGTFGPLSSQSWDQAVNPLVNIKLVFSSGLQVSGRPVIVKDGFYPGSL